MEMCTVGFCKFVIHYPTRDKILRYISVLLMSKTDYCTIWLLIFVGLKFSWISRDFYPQNMLCYTQCFDKQLNYTTKI